MLTQFPTKFPNQIVNCKRRFLLLCSAFCLFWTGGEQINNGKAGRLFLCSVLLLDMCLEFQSHVWACGIFLIFQENSWIMSSKRKSQPTRIMEDALPGAASPLFPSPGGLFGPFSMKANMAAEEGKTNQSDYLQALILHHQQQQQQQLLQQQKQQQQQQNSLPEIWKKLYAAKNLDLESR